MIALDVRCIAFASIFPGDLYNPFRVEYFNYRIRGLRPRLLTYFPCRGMEKTSILHGDDCQIH